VFDGLEWHPASLLIIGVCEILPGLRGVVGEFLVIVERHTALELPGRGDGVKDVTHLMACVDLPRRAQVLMDLLFDWPVNLRWVLDLWV
jgi:hypothetical protein